MVISNVHRSLNAGHRENYTQSVADRTRKRDILAKRKDSFTAIQKNLNKGKHKVKLTKKSANDKIKRKWTKTSHSVGSGYVQGRTGSGKILTSNP
ncbi:hypothetical protein pdam_00016668 [Pocillopora damicornis]|uniref:Uncharacterized protein n=1 Tax=Pocillopora damicornis TaxID=46731 RepID=A0A3M6U8J1_POCDA|nr:hypothetical protein pdam_00016668 [Pocillopora damicornis]